MYSHAYLFIYLSPIKFIYSFTCIFSYISAFLWQFLYYPNYCDKMYDTKDTENFSTGDKSFSCSSLEETLSENAIVVRCPPPPSLNPFAEAVVQDGDKWQAQREMTAAVLFRVWRWCQSNMGWSAVPTKGQFQQSIVYTVIGWVILPCWSWIQDYAYHFAERLCRRRHCIFSKVILRSFLCLTAQILHEGE